MTEITPELEAQIAKAIMENKPYLVELEEHVSQIKFGEMDVKFYVRGGMVEKMSFFNTKTWLKDKAS